MRENQNPCNAWWRKPTYCVKKGIMKYCAKKRNYEEAFLRSGPTPHFCSFFLEHKIMFWMK